MEFKTDAFGGARLEVPDNPTVFQLISYDSCRYELKELPAILLSWEMAKEVIIEWECEALPDIDTDLRELSDNANSAAQVIEWATTMINAWRRSLDNLPKK